MFLNLWQQPSKLIPPFDLFSLAGLASLLLAGCFFASSATPFPAASAPVLPAVAAADGATEVAACAADFFFFPPIMSPKLCLSASPLCGYVMPSHPQSPERWWLWTEPKNTAKVYSCPLRSHVGYSNFWTTQLPYRKYCRGEPRVVLWEVCP